MTKFRKVLSGVFGLYMVMALSLAHAEHPGQRIQEIYKQLNLTDGQKQQLEAGKQQHRSKMQSVREAMKADKEALRQELMKPQLDMPTINAIHHQIKALLVQMEDDRLSSILAVRAILTPDQFLKFIDLMHKHKEEHE